MAKITLSEPFRSMRFVMLLAAAIVNTVGFVAYHSAIYHGSDASYAPGSTPGVILTWRVMHYLAIPSFQVIFWVLVLLHFLGETPNIRSKQLFSIMGLIFFIIIGIKGLTVIYGEDQYSTALLYMPWRGTATTPTYVFCCLTIVLLLILELYFGYREDGCGCGTIIQEIEAA